MVLMSLNSFDLSDVAWKLEPAREGISLTGEGCNDEGLHQSSNHIALQNNKHSKQSGFSGVLHFNNSS